MINYELIKIILEYANIKCSYCNKYLDLYNLDNILIGNYAYYCSNGCITNYFLYA